MKFLRNLLASILGSLVAFGILMGMFFIFLALMGSVDDGVVVKKKSVLELSFVAPILDYTGKDETDPFAAFSGEELGLDEILHAIEVAKNDDNIEGISITTGYLMAGVAQTQEIRKALLDFKSSGKFVMAHSDVYAQRDYYLASAADERYTLTLLVFWILRDWPPKCFFIKSFRKNPGLKWKSSATESTKVPWSPFFPIP